MRGLWKISMRYIVAAILITVLMACANIILFVAFNYWNIERIGKTKIGRERMEAIVQEISWNGTSCELSAEGYAILEESSFVWAMLLDADGTVVWGYELPDGLWHQYSVADVAVFSRWYLEDYPTRVWRRGDELMVFGLDKDSVTRYDLLYDHGEIEAFPKIAAGMLFGNFALLIAVALCLAYRFYRSLRPIAEGVSYLAVKEPVTLPERGILKELAEKLNQTSALLLRQDAKLAQRDQARTDWIAGVSHDIRTPLTLIMGYADDLAGAPGLSLKEQQKAKGIQSQCLIIRQLIADLNLTSKLAYQSQALEKSDVSMAELLRECVAEYYNQGLSEKYEILLDIPEHAERVRIMADRGLLMRAFRNLIGNSIRHNPDGCLIQISLAVSTSGFDRETMRCVFADTGNGIPEEVARTILANAREGEVHVMGLRVVKQIVEAHGWHFELARRKMGGYDVTIWAS